MSLVAKLLPASHVRLDVQVSSKKRLFEQVGLLFENHDGIAAADAAREGANPPAIGIAAARASGRIRPAVPAGNVIGHEYRQRVCPGDRRDRGVHFATDVAHPVAEPPRGRLPGDLLRLPAQTHDFAPPLRSEFAVSGVWENTYTIIITINYS